MSTADLSPIPKYTLWPGDGTRWELTSEGCAAMLGGPYRFALEGPSPFRGTLAVQHAIPAPGLTWQVTFPDDLHLLYGTGVTVRINPALLYQNGTWFVYPVEEYA